MTRNDTQFTKWPLVAHIVATTEDGLIGIGNKLPWGFVKEDMKFFKSKTLHHVVLMGWNTVSGASEFGVCAIVDRVPRFFGRNSSRSDGDM